MATMSISIGSDWTDLAADASLTAGTRYVIQVLGADVTMIESTSETAPDTDDEGFVLYGDKGTIAFKHKSGNHVWLRVRRGFPGGSTIVIDERA